MGKALQKKKLSHWPSGMAIESKIGLICDIGVGTCWTWYQIHPHTFVGEQSMREAATEHSVLTALCGAIDDAKKRPLHKQKPWKRAVCVLNNK